MRDTGCGIAPDFMPFVFDRFRQLDSSSKRAHGGLGLGLAIVRHLVELHGGSVACESAGADRGATFTLRLPIRDRRSAAPTAVAPEVRQAGAMRPSSDEMVDLTGIKVLLVDDEPDARELLTEVLQQCGAVVVATHSADEAMRLIPRERPAVLLSDIGLPGEDGYKLISRVRALPPEEGGNLPAAAITAYARSDDARGRWPPATSGTRRSRSSRRRWPRWSRAWRRCAPTRQPRPSTRSRPAGRVRQSRARERPARACRVRAGRRRSVMRPRLSRKSRTTCVARSTSLPSKSP